MSQYEKKKIQSSGESLDIENSQKDVRQDTLMDPILSKAVQNTMLIGMDQTAVSGQPEDKGKCNQDEQPQMKISDVDAVPIIKDADTEKHVFGNVNPIFRGLRSAYEQFGERNNVEKQSEEKDVKNR